MLETLKHTIVINFSITLNSWIYFLKRIPLIKVLFKNVGYEYSEVTKVLYPLSFIYSMIKQLFKSLLLLGFSFGIPYLFLKEGISDLDKATIFWNIYFLFYILLAIPNSKILEPHKRKFISVKLMRMNARKFVLSDYLSQLLWRQIAELIPFIIVARFYNVNIAIALFLIVGKNIFALFTEAMQIKYYDKTGDFLHNKIMLNLIYALAILVIGYYTTITQVVLVIPDQVILFLGVLFWIIGLFSLRYIIRYNNYSAAINDANRMEKLNVDIKSAKKNAQFSSVKFKDKEFTKEDLQYDKSNKKEGFTYINDLFFKRHKRILNGPIKKQVAAVLLLFIVGIGLSYFIPDFNQEYVKGVKKIFPMFVFASYLMSTGQKATKAMFYNCDISLLHYGFYKTKEAVLATFTIRAKYLIITNLIPAGLLAVGIILLDVISGGAFITLLPIGIMILVLSVFFVIHNLFLYYIFQPFTTDLNVKNPFYKVFSAITYVLSYICLQLDNMSLTFLTIIVAVTLIYSIGALISVYRFAPRTFQVK